MPSGTRPRPLVVAALHVGSRLRTGWWRNAGTDTGSGGTDIDALCATLTDDLAAGADLALGFEAPLSVPIANSAADLGKARVGEPLPWSAGAGATVCTYGIQQAAYVLRQLASDWPAGAAVTLDPEELRSGAARLLVWEAFVSGRAKDATAAQPHVADAMAAVNEFRRRWDRGAITSDITIDAAISVAGLALHVADLTNEVSLLRSAPVVVRAPDLAIR